MLILMILVQKYKEGKVVERVVNLLIEGCLVTVDEEFFVGVIRGRF